MNSNETMTRKARLVPLINPSLTICTRFTQYIYANIAYTKYRFYTYYSLYIPRKFRDTKKINIVLTSVNTQTAVNPVMLSAFAGVISMPSGNKCAAAICVMCSRH